MTWVTGDALPERFWAKVDTDGPVAAGLPGRCMVWTNALNSKGYGVFWHEGQFHLAHRRLWQSGGGVLPDDLVLDHLCRRHECVNPGHLEVVTIAVNSERGLQQNRSLCKRGHLLAYRMRAGRPVRCCRRCEALRRAARRRTCGAAAPIGATA